MIKIGDVCIQFVEVSPGTCSQTRSFTFLGVTLVIWVGVSNRHVLRTKKRVMEWGISDRYFNSNSGANVANVRAVLEGWW